MALITDLDRIGAGVSLGGERARLFVGNDREDVIAANTKGDVFAITFDKSNSVRRTPGKTNIRITLTPEQTHGGVVVLSVGATCQD